METFIEILNDSGLLEILSQPDMLILIAMALLLQLFAVTQSKKSKSERSVAHFAENWTKYRLIRTAAKQLKAQNVKHVCLYCGSFKDWQLNPLVIWFYLLFLGRPPALFVPHANPGIQVVGAPGMGKTFSVIDRLLVSAIDQSYPILLYDYKYGNPNDDDDPSERKDGQTPFIGGYAARHGYKIRIFAPGKDYTCIINDLDFLKNDLDFTMCQTLVRTYESREANATSNKFFDSASQALLVTAILVAKGSKFPDLAMAAAIIQMPDLGQRLAYAIEQDRLSAWHEQGFSPYLSVALNKNDNTTAAGILAGAQNIISKFVRPDLVSCFVGKTNVSLDLGSKELLIFQSDEERQEILSPMNSAKIELVINRNFRKSRKIPLVFCVDEYPTIKSIQSIDWPARHRSKGLVMIYGYQSDPQILETYNSNMAGKLNAGIKTRFWFNPQSEETAKKWSDTMGKREVKIVNESKTINYGGQKSKTISTHYELEELRSPSNILKMKPFSCIYKNENSQNKKEAFIPIDIDRLHVSQEYIKMQNETAFMWHNNIESCLIKREKQYRSNQQIIGERILTDRKEESYRMFPMPEVPISPNFNINTSEFDFME
ncbi:MAG: type IV secretion system DNA-binding domain-containing protein [Pleurocapsa minor HA4230-MV1]|jgi:hypothetical protein|nr:type IV secretion system DNA-binding domain-containing protein [Pleurocapsa minor HA4230-MV1]